MLLVVVVEQVEGFAKDDFVFIRNNKGGGCWCFIFTFICATMGFLQQDVTFESP